MTNKARKAGMFVARRTDLDALPRLMTEKPTFPSSTFGPWDAGAGMLHEVFKLGFRNAKYGHAEQCARLGKPDRGGDWAGL
jgi:hypothetical protein